MRARPLKIKSFLLHETPGVELEAGYENRPYSITYEKNRHISAPG
jgi:hypothetical protein